MLDQYRELIDELLGTPGTVRRLLADLRHPADASVAGALIVQLRDRDAAVLARLQTMTREREPFLRSLPPADDLVAVAATPSLLDEFDTARGDLVSLLMNLTLRDWERTAIDETLGETSLSDEVERHVEFDEAHLARITATLAAG